MIAQGGGRIINIASTAGQTGSLSGPAYCASKAGVEGLTKSLARAFARHNILVNAIGPLTQSLGWTQLFVGVIIIAIVGNAAEHSSAITMAIKNKLDITIQIATGSATQMAIFVAPVLVLISMFFAQPMNLVFNMFELVSMILAVVIVNLVVQDGETNWLEGIQLLIAYGIMAVAFFLHP